MRDVYPVDAELTDVCCAFEYPLNPGDGLERQFIEALVDSSGTAALYEYLVRHAAIVASPVLYNCLAVSSASVAPSMVCEYRLRSDDSVGRVPVKVSFEPNSLEAFGILRCRGGHLLSATMFEAIADDINELYFYIEQFSV
jgi:hypothetical protein